MSAAPKPIDPAASSLRPALEVGEELIGEDCVYRIGQSIGKGGMGEVFRAERAGSPEPVAIKVLSLKEDDPTARLRFAFEGQALKEIRHPNVVPVLATGIRKKDGMGWMAMPLLRGQPLNQILEQRRGLPIPWAVEIIRDVCRGLQAIHSVAIHRDIKPPNLFLCINGVVQILDLGAGKFLHKGLVKTTTGFQLGTLPYMSPEQIRSQPLDPRSDLFSTTVVLYELLTGRHPFLDDDEDPGWFEICTQIVGKPHISPTERAPWLPRYIVEILNKGLAKEPGHRFRSAEEMRDVLSSALHRLAADLGHVEPLQTFAAGLAAPASGPARSTATVEPQVGPGTRGAPDAPAMPRTTLPMAPPKPKNTAPGLLRLAPAAEGERTTVPIDPSSPPSSPLSPAAREVALSLAATEEAPVAAGAPTSLRDSGVVIKEQAPQAPPAAAPTPPAPSPARPPIVSLFAAPVLGFGAPVPARVQAPSAVAARRRRWPVALLGGLGLVTALAGGVAAFELREAPTSPLTTPPADPTTPPLPTETAPPSVDPPTAPPAPPTSTGAASSPSATASARRPAAPPPRRRPAPGPAAPPAPTARGRLFGTDP